MKPLEDVLPAAERDRLRRDSLAIPGWYNPWAHLGLTSIWGLGWIAAGVLLIQQLDWWEAAYGAGLFILSNAFEWRVHRDVLHKRQKVASILYDRHTPQHHMIFVTDDMAIRETREFRNVLLPAYAIVLIFVGLSPLYLGLWLGGERDLACVTAIVTMGYIVSYEWLHLSYHLPVDSLIGRLGVVRFLRRHHAIHHHPRLMQKWNFNVSLPLWDAVRRTYVRDDTRFNALQGRPV